MHSLVRMLKPIVVVSVFLPVLVGQQANPSIGAQATQAPGNTTPAQQDPIADIARASLSASCDPNSTPAQLQAAQDRLARLQSILADVSAARADAAGQLKSGDSLSWWSNLTGGAQILQGAADGTLSLYSYLTGSNINKTYNVGKSLGDCANAALSQTKSPGECVSSLAKSADEALPSWAKIPGLAYAGIAVGVGDKAVSGKETEFAEKGEILIKGAAVAVKKGLMDEHLGEGVGTAADVFKGAMTALSGIDNLSTASADGSNLNTVTSSAFNSARNRENDLSAKVAAAKNEVDRLAQCQQQLDAAGLSSSTKTDAPKTDTATKAPRSLDDVMDTLGPLMADPSGNGSSGGNSAMLQKLADSMAEASSASSGAGTNLPQLPQIDSVSGLSSGQSPDDSGLDSLSTLMNQLKVPKTSPPSYQAGGQTNPSLIPRNTAQQQSKPSTGCVDVKTGKPLPAGTCGPIDVAGSGK
jgi:hypothetical protein